MIKPVSLQNRLLLTVLVGLIVLGFTHLVLSTFHANMMHYSKEQELTEYAGMLKGSINETPEGVLVMRYPPPDPRFLQKSSGLGAAIFSDKDKMVWLSPSVEGYPELPKRSPDSAKAGSFVPGETQDSWHRFVAPVTIGKNSDVYRIYVFEDAGPSIVTQKAFKDAIYVALLVALVCILAAQSFTAQWFLRPFRRLKKELDSIKSGDQSTFQARYPEELQSLAESINELITHEDEQTESYRNSLSNLAHSLKTPLAVMKGTLDQPDDEMLRHELRQQVEKIDGLVMYQLSLASRSGKTTYIQPLSLHPLVEDIVTGLEKIHAKKGAFCEFEIPDEGIKYPANRGDMQELLGNLLENGFKWCRSRVLLTLTEEKENLSIIVEDDGPGVPSEKVSVIMERGIRADEHVQGHGIGLAIVSDILRSYRGTLNISSSEELGGASFHILLPKHHGKNKKNP